MHERKVNRGTRCELMRLADGTRAIILVGLGVIGIITYGVTSSAGVIGLAISLLVVSLLVELTIRR